MTLRGTARRSGLIPQPAARHDHERHANRPKPRAKPQYIVNTPAPYLAVACALLRDEEGPLTSAPRRGRMRRDIDRSAFHGFAPLRTGERRHFSGERALNSLHFLTAASGRFLRTLRCAALSLRPPLLHCEHFAHPASVARKLQTSRRISAILTKLTTIRALIHARNFESSAFGVDVWCNCLRHRAGLTLGLGAANARDSPAYDV